MCIHYLTRVCVDYDDYFGQCFTAGMITLKVHTMLTDDLMHMIILQIPSLFLFADQRAFRMWKNWENICYTSKCVWSWSSYSYPWNLDDMKEARLSQCIFPIIRLYSFLYSRKWQETICPIQDMATRVDNTNHISSNVSIIAPSVCWTEHHGVKELIPIQYGNIYWQFKWDSDELRSDIMKSLTWVHIAHTWTYLWYSVIMKPKPTVHEQ